MSENLAILSVDLGVDQQLRPDFVIVVIVAGGVLEVPLQLAALDVERHARVGVEVVARTIFGVEHRHRIARAPVGGLGFGVIRTRHPHAAAAGLPAVGVARFVALPGFRTRLALVGHRIEAPQLVARIDLQRRDIAAGRPVTIGLADQHLVAHHQRCSNEAFAGPADLLVPDHVAGFAVAGDHVAIEEPTDDQFARERETTMRDQEAGRGVLLDAGIAGPDEFGGLAVRYVELVGRAPGVRHIKEAIVGQRRGFDRANAEATRLGATDGCCRDHMQTCDVAGVDLVERRKPVRIVGLADHQPVTGFGVGPCVQ